MAQRLRKLFARSATTRGADLRRNAAPVRALAPAGDGSRVATLDLAPALRELDEAYVARANGDAHAVRITGLASCPMAGELYVQVGEGRVFVSHDGMRTLAEVAEINRRDGMLVVEARQSVDCIVESVEGTIIAIGRDRTAEDERSVVWRKPRGAQSFTRSVIAGSAWATSKNGNACAGWFGEQHAPAIVVVPYTDGDARIVTSVDDGLHWRVHDVSRYFAHHAHEAYLPPSVGNQRVARLWLTGGDDPSGERSGLVCFSGFDGSGELLPATWVLRERPGYRLVGLAGNGRHVYVGNESIAGGLLRIEDNQESIGAASFTYCVGKSRHDYHQFRSLAVTFDGLVVSGTDSYRQYAGDTVRADGGGYLYVSTNEGASAIEIPLGGTWTTGVVCDADAIWCAVSATSSSGPDVSTHALTLLRVSRPDPLVPVVPPFVCKPVVADSSRFYTMAGYANPPMATLAPGECTWRVDMSCWTWLGLDVVAKTTGRLAIEGLAYGTWSLAEEAWQRVIVLDCDVGSLAVELPPSALAFRYLRARNTGEAPMTLESLAFVGRR